MCFPPKNDEKWIKWIKRCSRNKPRQIVFWISDDCAIDIRDFRVFIECCFHAYFWCAFSLRRLRLTQGRQDTPSPKYENNIPWTATDIPDINTLHSLSHNLCLRYLDFQKLYNICTIGAHVGRFDLSPPLRPEKGVGGTRALAHSIYMRYVEILPESKHLTMATKLTTLEPFFPFFLALGNRRTRLAKCSALLHCWCFQFALLWIAHNGIKSIDKLWQTECRL